MRYLHIISSLDPRGGGPAEGVRQLATVACRLGHQVEVACLDDPGSDWGRDLCCPVHRLGPGRFGRYAFAPRFAAWLQDNLPRFSAVIVNGLWQYHGVASWRVLRKSSIPYFVFTHGMLDPWFKREYPLKHLKKWLYWPWADYRLLRDARAVLFTCDEERLQARRSFWLYRARERVVSYGTPGPAGDADAQRAGFLDAFPSLRGCRFLLFLGRIHPKKGCDLLVEAFARMRLRDPGLHLVVAGPAEEVLQRQLAQRAAALGAAGHITWTGMLSGDMKWGAFRAAEAFVLPSHQENFGIAVAEALACGTPVLISDKVNIWREILADEAGLVEPDTLEGTTRLLQRWVELGPAGRTALARRAETTFRSRFHIDRAAQDLLEVLVSSQRGRHAPPGSLLAA